MDTITLVKNEVIPAFPLPGTLRSVEAYGNGHINETFAAAFQQPDGTTLRFTIQQINTSVFRDPARLMENVAGVTEFLRARIRADGGDPERETLRVIPTRDGKNFFTDAQGGCWRCYRFIEGVVTYELVEKPEDFYTVARAFGRFQRQLADYPAETLHESIPNFHNTASRFADFQRAVREDRMGRAKEVQREIDFVLRREADTHTLVDFLEQGELPLRVTHNDTKLNNILIDADTGEGICVIDLDTVMPGLAHYDYGDSIRFGASTALEDEKDLSRVSMDLELFEAFTKGFLETAGEVFTDREKELLPMGAKLMTLECGMRFLADHLNGDTYFKIHREGHNLDRARTQFKLVEDMERKWDAMHEVVKRYA